MTTQVEQLWLLRILQAISGGMATVTVGAMVRDRYDGQKSAQVLSLIALIMMSAPLLAPALGAAILHYLNWHSIFIFLALYAAAVLAICTLRLVETKPTRTPVHSQPSHWWHSYTSVLRHRQAMRYVISVAFSFSAMFVFITDAAYIYMDYLGASSDWFPFLFGANIVTMMMCNRINITLLKHHPRERILRGGIIVQCIGTTGFTLVALFGIEHLWSVLPFIMLSVGSLGLIGANAISLTLSFFPNNSGAANAILGTSEFFCAGAIGTAVSMLPHNNLLPSAAGMLCCALCSLLVLCYFKR